MEHADLADRHKNLETTPPPQPSAILEPAWPQFHRGAGTGGTAAIPETHTRLTGTGETVRIAADQVFSAIGQTLATDGGLALDGRKIAVTGAGRTSRDRVWAGGDCASGGDDLTVTAVAEGRDAAMDIYATLMGGAN